MVFSDLVVVHNGGFLLRNHLAFAMKENDGADRLALGQNLLRGRLGVDHMTGVCAHFQTEGVGSP